MLGRRLVGRDPELGGLIAGLELACGGRGNIHLLCGEPGIGKSRLAEELAQQARARDATVLFGRCWEAGGAPAFWPWVEALHGLLDPMEESERARVLGAGASDVAQILPELSREAPPAVMGHRFRLFDAVTSCLARASSRRPIALFLEDLHASDSPSLLLLSFVAQRLGQQRVFVLGTYRDLEARLAPEISELLRKIDRSGRTISLRRLRREDVAVLCESAGAEVADRVFAVSEGNPLFIDQLLRIIEVRGGDPNAVEIPDHVRDAIRERLDRVDPSDRPILEAGAAIGRQFAATMAARVLGSAPEALGPALARAVALGLLSPAGTDQYSFTHVLIREVIHDSMPSDRRSDLHRRIADALQQLHGSDPEAPLREIAHHLVLAGAAHAERALEALSSASDRAMKMLAFEEAIAVSSEALRILDLAAPGDAARRFELLVAIGRARMQAGQYERGKEACVAAAKLARELGSAQGIARAALELGGRLQIGITDRTLVELLEEARVVLPEGDGALRARVNARLAAALLPCRDPDGPIDMALAAVEMAHRVSDRPTLLGVLHWAGSALPHFAPVQQRIAIDTETVAIAIELRDKMTALRGYSRLIWDHVELGDFLRADECIRAYESLAAEFRLPHVAWQACLFRSMRASMEGRFDDSEREQARARELIATSEDGMALRHLAVHAVGVARMKGDEAEVARALDWASKNVEAPMAAMCRCLVPFYGEREALVPALEAFRRFPAERDASNVVILAECAFRLEDVALAESLLRWVDLHSDHFAHFGSLGYSCEGPIERGLMLVDALLGRWDGADAHFQRGHRKATEVGARPIVAHFELDYARALMRRGRTEDRARAASLAGSAAALGRQLGMNDFADRAARLSQELGARSESEQTYGGGRYVVQRTLGQGGQKTVYLVRDTALERDCALAVIDRLESADRERLRSEGLALAKMGTHPNVVTVFDIGEESSRPYLVMELVAGGDLGEALAAGALEPSRAVEVARDLLRGLAAIHERGIVHRDLKPSNVWLDAEQNAKIGDFGLALLHDSPRRTSAGELLATAEYASPEQLEDRPIDARSDLYSLGCLLYELLTARTPFVGTMVAVIGQHLHAKPTPPSAHNPKVSPALDRFVLHLMEKSPDDRPLDARAALEELEACEPVQDLEARIRDEKLASLSDLVAGIAHEMNTPLGALQANTDVLLRAVAMIEEALADRGTVDDPRIARALATLSRAKGVTPEATQRLARVIRDLKSFARLDQAEEELFDLTSGLESTLSLLQHEIADRITIVRSYRELPQIRCRPAELNQVFLNVLKNATQAIEERGTITVTAAQEGDAVVVRIADTGRGIAGELLGRVFDPGFTTKGVGVGTGLGLSIAHRIVQEHGGAISVESALDQGTVVTIRLPVRP